MLYSVCKLVVVAISNWLIQNLRSMEGAVSRFRINDCSNQNCRLVERQMPIVGELIRNEDFGWRISVMDGKFGFLSYFLSGHIVS